MRLTRCSMLRLVFPVDYPHTEDVSQFSIRNAATLRERLGLRPLTEAGGANSSRIKSVLGSQQLASRRLTTIKHRQSHGLFAVVYFPAAAATWLPPNTSRTCRPRVANRKGFCRNTCLGSRPCWFESKLFEYADINTTRISGRMLAILSDNSRPLISGMIKSVNKSSIGPPCCSATWRASGPPLAVSTV